MKVLVTCASSAIMPLDVLPLIDSIKNVDEIILCDAEEIFINSYTKYQVPLGSSDNYLNCLSNIIEKEQISFIFVCSDEEALAISKDPWLSKITHLDSCKNIEIILDKFTLHEKIFGSLGPSHVPRYIRNIDFKSIKDFVYNVDYSIMRPVKGRGSKGLKFLDFTSTESKNSFLDEIDVNFPTDTFLAEYLPGDKYSIDCLFKNGELSTCMIRNNGPLIKYQPPTVFAETSCDTGVYKYALSIGSALNLSGFHQIECGKTINGTVKLIEINPRLDATLPITICYNENFYECIINSSAAGLLVPKSKYFKRFFSAQAF